MGCSDIWTRAGLLLHGAIMNKMSYSMYLCMYRAIACFGIATVICLLGMLGKGHLNWKADSAKTIREMCKTSDELSSHVKCTSGCHVAIMGSPWSVRQRERSSYQGQAARG